MATLTDLDDLAAAMQVGDHELISLIGGGGKTTTLFCLGNQLQGTTILTTTTKMGADQSSGHRVLLDPSDHELVSELERSRRVLAWHAADERRAIGVSAATCDQWFDLADYVVTEADGSRKRPFKAPAEHEPVVPSRTTLLVSCIGASAFGRPINECCHRPERVADIAGCTVNDRLTPERAAAVLLSDSGSRKGLPAASRFVVALHRVTPEMTPLIDELTTHLGDTLLLAVREISD